MQKRNNKAVIMAGGSGTRLWPLSVKSKPKQFQAIISENTMLQDTFYRLRKKFRADDVYVSTNINFVNEVKNQLPEIPKRNIIAEPVARGTASSIVLVTAVILSHDENSLISIFPADHLIKKEEEFANFINIGEEYIASNPKNILTFGIVPDYPETGYGYIKVKESSEIGEVAPVEAFVEKPDMDTAKKYVESGNYYWNAGMYILDAQEVKNKFFKYIPSMGAKLEFFYKKANDDNFEEVLSKEYPLLDNINFEYAVVENDKNVSVLPVDIGWSDVGSWSSLKDAIVRTKDEHLVKGTHKDYESENLLVYGKDKLVVTVGVKDLVIVDTDDAILVCHRDKSQMIGDIAKKIQSDINNNN